ncbi:alpha/beta hydrolase-fold protein [Niveibacterium sp. SC-1]|uniref:alpha/beta hydrolase n=1 Tax=Niveibacterium sp. SC-1 TaxID=3135646 RepID=UPI00311F8560
MNATSWQHWRAHWTRLLAIAALAALASALAACGGGGGADEAAHPIQGSRETKSIASRITGTEYPLRIYLPPASAGPRNQLPVIYVLDGEGWFDTLVGNVEAAQRGVIIVGVETAGQRNRDFVPANTCTPHGGGYVAYFDFVRQELIPFVEGSIGGDPAQRALFGHSHGGSLVLYALFSEPPGGHSFKAYLASDASIGCMPAVARDWEHDYAAAYRDLPVRLHLSYASAGNAGPNAQYATVIEQSGYAGLSFKRQLYNGTHGGIVPQVLNDVVGFAFDD